MRSIRYLQVAAALTLVPVAVPNPARATNVGEASIAVLELRPTSPEDGRLAELLSDALAVGVGATHKGKVVSQREVAARINANAQQQLMGCADDKCVVDLSRGLAVDQVISGRMGVLNGQVLVFLSLLSMKDGSTLARTSLSLPANDKQLAKLVEQQGPAVLGDSPMQVLAMERAAKALFAEDHEKTADQKLTDLRIAVLFDEVKADGREMVGRPVEGCVENEFRMAGADIESGAGLANLKGKAGPRTLLQGGVPEGIDAGDVDVIVVGAVEYETTKNEALGIYATGAALTLSLMKIDTAEVIANAAPRGRGTGHGAQESQRTAAADVCKLVRPALQEALAARVKRGERVVVEVRGVDGPTAANAIVDLLARQKQVGRAKLKRVQGGKATIDVVVKGDDGVALALALASTADAPRVLEAGPASLKLTLEKPKADKSTVRKNTAPAATPG